MQTLSLPIPVPGPTRRLLHVLRPLRTLRLLRRAAAARARRRRHAVQARELATMNDHALRDLGLGRSQVPGLFEPRG